MIFTSQVNFEDEFGTRIKRKSIKILYLTFTSFSLNDFGVRIHISHYRKSQIRYRPLTFLAMNHWLGYCTSRNYRQMDISGLNKFIHMFSVKVCEWISSFGVVLTEYGSLSWRCALYILIILFIASKTSTADTQGDQ
jgi:hypothetical protein